MPKKCTDITGGVVRNDEGCEFIEIFSGEPYLVSTGAVYGHLGGRPPPAVIGDF